MYQKEVIPDCIAIGISYEDFWHLTPRILNCYIEGHIRRKKEADLMNWYMGQYMCSAIASCFDKKTKYVDRPFLSDLGLSEEEIADREINKMIEVERLWSENARQKGLRSINNGRE